jgi:hypothetical protein
MPRRWPNCPMMAQPYRRCSVRPSRRYKAGQGPAAASSRIKSEGRRRPAR